VCTKENEYIKQKSSEIGVKTNPFLLIIRHLFYLAASILVLYYKI